MVDTELLLGVWEVVIKSSLHLLVKIANHHIRRSYLGSFEQLSGSFCKKLEAFKPFIVDQTKRSVENSAEAGLAGYLEEWELKAVGIVGIVDAKDLWEALPHLDTVRKCPDQANQASWIAFCPLHHVGNLLFIEKLDQRSSWAIAIELFPVDERPCVIDIPLCQGRARMLVRHNCPDIARTDPNPTAGCFNCCFEGAS